MAKPFVTPASSPLFAWLLVLALLVSGCGRQRDASGEGATGEGQTPVARAFLIVTLDTTRADATNPYRASSADSSAVTPALAELSARGSWFAHAYASAPMTLPSHVSMWSGLYPAEHGVHENARFLDPQRPLIQEHLDAAGFETAAFVSARPLDRSFGLARGFHHYDDDFEGPERSAEATTDRAIEWLDGASGDSALIWVHYFDAHDPYEPPAEFASQFDDPYLGEIRYVDSQMGRLVEQFERRFPEAERFIAVLGDHGEGRGDHGEQLHGNLLYQGTMRVPLVLVGPGVDVGRRDDAVSVAGLAATLAGLAKVDFGPAEVPGWLASTAEARAGVPVVAESMKPFLQYGWQPQTMAVAGGWKLIKSGGYELYDLVNDPDELEDLASQSEIPEALSVAVDSYSLPTPSSGASDRSASTVDAQTALELQSLGYSPSVGIVQQRDGAPSARQMVHLFADFDRASGLFVRGDFQGAIPVLERLRRQDPENLMLSLRLAVAHSSLGHPRAADQSFADARQIAPDHLDVAHFEGLHRLRLGELAPAESLLRKVLAEQPGRAGALDGLSELLLRSGRVEEAVPLLERLLAANGEPAVALRLARAAMSLGRTETAVTAYETARRAQLREFSDPLELGVLYLATGRVGESQELLDEALKRYEAGDPRLAMALFKRAQVSAILGEPDLAERIAEARRSATPETELLIANERLFADL